VSQITHISQNLSNSLKTLHTVAQKFHSDELFVNFINCLNLYQQEVEEISTAIAGLSTEELSQVLLELEGKFEFLNKQSLNS
jgi:histone deacetylase complex regulatory component SIN3